MHNSWFFNNNLIHLVKSFLNEYFSSADTKNKLLTESKAFSMSTVSKILSVFNKSVISAISEISLPPSLLNILFKYTIWCLVVKLFKIFFNFIAILKLIQYLYLTKKHGTYSWLAVYLCLFSWLIWLQLVSGK